jgi:hypothetical protein
MSYRFGPSGGIGGDPFTTSPPAENGPWKISMIKVWSEDRINALEVVWTNPLGEVRTSPKFGGSDGHQHEFEIDKDDQLVRIEGSTEVVKFWEGLSWYQFCSLQFFTQQGRSSPLYGQQWGVGFSYDGVPDHQVIGFYGRSSSWIEALGVMIDQA